MASIMGLTRYIFFPFKQNKTVGLVGLIAVRHTKMNGKTCLSRLLSLSSANDFVG
jgi:hypothetical protein